MLSLHVGFMLGGNAATIDRGNYGEHTDRKISVGKV